MSENEVRLFSEWFDEERFINDHHVAYVRHTIGVAESDDLKHWRKKGPIAIDIPGDGDRDFGIPQWVGEKRVRLHIGIARPSVVSTGAAWRMYFDRSGPNAAASEKPSHEYPGIASVNGRFCAYAETTDPQLRTWEFKGDLHHAVARYDVDPNVAHINGQYFKLTACYEKRFFGAVSEDGVEFEWVSNHREASPGSEGLILPPHGSETFADGEAHAYDYLTASPALIHDGDRLYGFLYGTSAKGKPMIHGRICEVFLQRKVLHSW